MPVRSDNMWQRIFTSSQSADTRRAENALVFEFQIFEKKNIARNILTDE